MRRTTSEWAVVAGVLEGLQIDYGSRLSGWPQQVRVHSADPRQASQVDLQLRLQSFEMNAEIDRAAFTVAIPPGTSSITVQELRESYHR